MPSRLKRRLASSSAIRRSSTSRNLASARALARAERSSSVRVRKITPELLRGGGGAAVRVTGGGATGLAAAGSGVGVSAGPSPPRRRLPRFSTTTCLVRPWLKLWRTVPVSTRGLSVKVLVGTLNFLSPGVLVSTIQHPNPVGSCVVRTVLNLRILVHVLGRGSVVVRHPVSDQHLAT